MSIFGSTSPSYLILQSLDLCNRYIEEKIKDDITACRKKTEEIRAVMPVADVSDEPLKITADMRCVANRDVFEKAGIEPEFADDDFTVFMKALNTLTVNLCRMIAGDGEGATKLLECVVTGAKDEETAKICAKSVMYFFLFK